MSNFWSDVQLEPKRQFQFLFLIPGDASIETYVVKSVNKPAVTIGQGANINYLQHTFKYPGKLTWNDISVTLLDTIDVDDTTSKLSRMIRESGYVIPDSETNAQFSFSKKSATNALNKPVIQQLDAGIPGERAPKVVEEWTLWNAWIKSVTFGAGLAYGNDSIVECTLGISYDWAAYTTLPGSGYADQGGFQKLPSS